MLKDIKAAECDWGEIAKLKIDLKQTKMAETVHTILIFYQDNKDKNADELLKKLNEMDAALCSAEDRIVELEKQQGPLVQVIAVPEELKERIEQIIIEKRGDAADRNEEAVAAWKTWLADYEAAKRNFAKVRERAGIRTEIEVGYGYDKAVLAALVRHGFIKRLENNRFQLLK